MPSGDETARRAGKASSVNGQLDDIVVGVITGGVCSVLAAVIEVSIASVRVFSFGRIGGGGLAGEIVTIALVGAVVGGLVALFLGVRAKSREMTR
jgi:hypothetical protein